MKDTTAMRFLVVIETQKVKSYLFTSPIMRETRGSSVLLDLLNRKETKIILKQFHNNAYEEIYLGGGSGRILFMKKEDAEMFKSEILNLYRQETVNARISVEIVEREKKDGKDEPFTEWVSRGVMMTQQSKLGRVEGIPVLAGRWIRPCTSCGSEPSEEILLEHSEHWLCRACLKKRNKVNDLYKEIKPTKRGDRVLKSSSELEHKYTDNFIFSTLSKCNEKANCQVFLPQSFDDIGQFSRPSNYMGFIYADGNRMGEVIKRIGYLFPEDDDAILAYKAFSEIVDQATRDAAVEAVLKVVDRDEWDKFRFIPAEFIMAGGDDLMLAVPSHNAMDVTVLFIDKFQEKTKELQEKYRKQKRLSKFFAENGLTTSAGVVIAHSHYPVSDLMALAGELMKLAKEKSSELHKQGHETGTLDFLVLTESSSESVKQRRNKEYTKPLNSSLKVKLTERPYTTAETRWLLNTIKKLKDPNVPRSKLKALYPVLFQSPPQAQFDALRIKERLKATGCLEENSTFFQLVTELDVFPFRKQDDNLWTTPLTEIIELYDFIQNKGDGRECQIELKKEIIHD